MPKKCQLCLAAVLLQIILVVWYFSTKTYPSNSVLRRLQHDPNSGTGPALLHVVDDPTLDVFKWYGAEVCIKEGSNTTASSGERCVCKAGWGGRRCGLPQSVLSRNWMTEPKLVAGLQVRKRPRRIILFISDYFHDAKLLELNTRMLGDLVDVYVIGEEEAKYERRNESLVHMLHNGFLQNFHDKLVYVNITEPFLLPIDKLHFTVKRGLALLSDLRIDDLFLFISPEDIISRDFILFLKLFYNYPEPVRCNLKQHIYSLAWAWPRAKPMRTDLENVAAQLKISEPKRRSTDDSLNTAIGGAGALNDGQELKFDNALFSRLYSDHLSDIPDVDALPSICAISVHVFSNVFENKVRRLLHENLLLKVPHLEFFNSLSHPVFPWNYENAGWRCHFCLSSSSEIYSKLKLLPKQDRPVWFRDDFAEQAAMLSHIERLKAKGQSEYFGQDTQNLSFGVRSPPEDMPSFVLDHRDQYRELLSP